MITAKPSRQSLRVLTDAAQCSKCALAVDGAPDPERGPVFGDPAGDGRVVIVGEAPGEHEAREGHPFIGPSGKLLWRTLLQLGYRKEQLYLTNALACVPPSSVKTLTKPIQCCAPRLEIELDALPQKRLIICVGAVAAQAVTGEKRTMTMLNGHSEWSERWGCRVAFAYHPAYVLRVPEAYNDFKTALKNARGAQPTTEDVTWEVLDTPSSAAQWVLAMLQMPPKRIACDIETTGLNPFCDQLLEVGFATDDTHAILIPAEVLLTPQVRDVLNVWLREPNIQWIYHNGKFDTSWLLHHGLPARCDIDTMLLHYCLEEWSAHDLKSLAFRYLHVPSYGHDIERSAMGGVPIQERRAYHAKDCAYTFRLEHVLRDLLAEEPPSRKGWPMPQATHDKLLIPALAAIRAIERRGIRVDETRLKELTASYTAQIEAARVQCVELIGQDPQTSKFNPTSWQHVKRVLDAFGFPWLGSTNELTLHALQRWETEMNLTPNPFLDAVINYRSLRHTKGTYLDGVATRLLRAPTDGRLRGNFQLHRTVTGRLSSTDPNLQNIPAGSVIKSLFVPSKGRVLLYADYNRLEVGVAAWYSGDSQLLHDYKAADFHWETAKRVWPRLVAQMEHARAAGSLADLETICHQATFFADFALRQSRRAERTEDVDTLYGWLKTRIRRQAKYLTFGVLFGEGAQGLSNPEKGMGVPKQVAQQYLDAWKRTYSGVTAFMGQNVSLAKRERWVESASGRRRRFPYPSSLSGSFATEAQNAPIQALASDICLTATCRLENERLSPTGRGGVLLTVHDSVLVEIDEDWIEEGKEIVRETMETVLPADDITFTVEMKTGATWEECE